MSVKPGQNLLNYRIGDKIGEGGMGVVWKALDTTLDRTVAIKLLPETFGEDPERLWGADPLGLSGRFVRAGVNSGDISPNPGRWDLENVDRFDYPLHQSFSTE